MKTQNPPGVEVNPFAIGVNAKAALITEDFQIVVLRRSPDDEDRPGELDLPGGGLNLLPNGDLETPKQAGERETGEETSLRPGISSLVGALTLVTIVPKLKSDGVFKLSYIFGAPTTATVEDIILPRTEATGEPEHTEAMLMPVPTFIRPLLIPHL